MEDTAVTQLDFYLDPRLHEGRPQDSSGRLEKELRTYDLLDSLGIPYHRMDHGPAATIECCGDIEERLGIDICKNLFLCNAQKTRFYLLAMPGRKKFKTALLSKQIGSSRLSFAGPEHMEELLGLTPGSVSILGLMNDREGRVELLIDRDVVEGREFIGCHPCINTSSLRIRTADILDRFLPYIHHGYTLVDLPFIE